MAHLLGNNPGHQDAGEILLSNFTQMALQMEAQRRLLRPPPSTKPRRSKKGQKKQPQRGLGVAQLEKIRLEEQRRASQQLAALRQLQAGQAMAFNSHVNGLASSAPVSVISQYDRESNHGSSLLASAMATDGTHLDTIRNAFCLNNVSSIMNTSAPSTIPLDLFPKDNVAASELTIKRPDSSTWPHDRIVHLRNPATSSNGDHPLLLQDSQSMLRVAACDEANKSQEQFQQMRPSNTDVRMNPSRLSQLTKLSSPSLNLERMMELSSFQNALRGQQAAAAAMTAVSAKRQVCGLMQKAANNGGGKLSELPIWKPPTIDSKLLLHRAKENLGGVGRSNGNDVCELTLRPPGAHVDPPSPQAFMTDCESRGARGPRDFLSLSVSSATWPNDRFAESRPHSSTPSPISAKSSTSTEENMSSWSCTTNFFSTQEGNHPVQLQVNPTFECGVSIDLTLRL